MQFFLIVILYALESLLQRYTRTPTLSCALILCGTILSVPTVISCESGGAAPLYILYNGAAQGILCAGIAVYLHDVLLVSR